MQYALGFKKRYILLALLIFLLIYVLWQVVRFSPFEESIIRRENINPSTDLYITQGSAGATTKNVYQYYLVPINITDEDFYKRVGGKYRSFLSTSDESAQLMIKASAVHITTKGDVYRFNNLTSTTFIYLNASAF